MHKKSFSALFALFMLLMIMPFAPGVINIKSACADTIEGPSPFVEPFDATSVITASDIISMGCVGSYELTTINVERMPLVFGVSVEKSAESPPAYQAQLVEKSHGYIELNPGEALTVWVDFLNTGTTTWNNTGGSFIALNVAGPAGRDSLFRHKYWNEFYYRPTRLLQNDVKPGETGRFRFAVKAPNVEDYYIEKFNLVAEDLLWIGGGALTIKFKVGDPPEQIPVYTIENEPTVRIGLFQTTETVVITADGSYTITNEQTDSRSKKATDAVTSVQPDENTYLRFSADDNDTILQITSFVNTPVWNSELNDNKFRGTIEIRTSEKTGETWIINELPIDSYLRGLAEVANEQPEEYLKALITAARSYVLWHKIHGGKHADNYYDINATTDQVYRGYGFEERSIDPLQTVIDTAGTVITHPDAVSSINPQGIAIAAYSSGTDGRTRNWSEVWAGSGFPWLVSVDDPYGAISNWSTLEGNHMVGMSAQGARGYAIEEDKTYDWILKHYYTGVSVEAIY